MLSTRARKLCPEACLVSGKQFAGFVDSVIVGNAREAAAARFLGNGLLLLVSREEVKAGDEENLCSTAASLGPAVEIGKFGSCGRVLLIVSGVIDGISLLYAFVDDPTALIAVLLLPVDNLVVADMCLRGFYQTIINNN